MQSPEEMPAPPPLPVNPAPVPMSINASYVEHAGRRYVLLTVFTPVGPNTYWLEVDKVDLVVNMLKAAKVQAEIGLTVVRQNGKGLIRP